MRKRATQSERERQREGEKERGTTRKDMEKEKKVSVEERKRIEGRKERDKREGSSAVSLHIRNGCAQTNGKLTGISVLNAKSIRLMKIKDSQFFIW